MSGQQNEQPMWDDVPLPQVHWRVVEVLDDGSVLEVESVGDGVTQPQNFQASSDEIIVEADPTPQTKQTWW